MVVAALVPRGWPKGGYAVVTATLAGAAMVMSVFNWRDVQDHGAQSLVGGAIALDGFSVFITVVICAAVIMTALIADDFLRREGQDGCELYALMLMAAAGGIVMGSANDLIVLFLGLETLSIALYVMAASNPKRLQSQESAIKYFILGGFSSAFFLYGVALVYGATGSTSLPKIMDFLATTNLLNERLLLAGMALLMVGFGFKVAAAPFHIWVPDVYQGAPTPVTSFMASVGKVAAFAALLRVFVVALGQYESDWRPLLWVLAVLTLLVGSVLAVVQTDVKRMLAYSSISHAGFILVGVQAANAKGVAGSLFYLLTYAFLVAGTFAVVTVVVGPGDSQTGLDAFRGLARRRPSLALALTVLLLAQAGVPLTAGFDAKFEVIVAAVDAKSYVLAVIAMLCSVIAAFVYLRITVSMYSTDGEVPAKRLRVPIGAATAVTIAVTFTLVVGFFPSNLIDLARDAVPVIVSGS